IALDGPRPPGDDVPTLSLERARAAGLWRCADALIAADDAAIPVVAEGRGDGRLRYAVIRACEGGPVADLRGIEGADWGTLVGRLERWLGVGLKPTVPGDGKVTVIIPTRSRPH